MFVIIKWANRADVSLVLDEHGKAMIFNEGNEALFYAKSELSPMWEVVEL